MIQGIRRKFILIAVAVLAAAMIMLAAIINISNWINVRNEMQETLAGIAESSDTGGRMENGPGKKGRNRHMQNMLEESRFFLVRLSGSGEFTVTDADRISVESGEELTEIVRTALSSGKRTGMVGHYMYLMPEDDGKNTAVFLDCETKLDALNRLLLISAVACAGGIVCAWLLVVLFSKRAVQPLIRNAVQQKQFITDAGHELKTPLTVISANMDALELETAPNEWIGSTREQLSNMSGLVNNMIYLSRMDEDGAALSREPVDFSEVVRREAEPFQSMAEFMGKTLELDVADGVIVRGDREALRRTVNQLCDNAMKYSPDGDTIRIRLYRSGREILMTEENSLKEPLSKETLSHLFERFYRPDFSRSRESGGYGIGLSMVKAVAEKHGGRARAEITEDGRICFTVSFPS